MLAMRAARASAYRVIGAGADEIFETRDDVRSRVRACYVPAARLVVLQARGRFGPAGPLALIALSSRLNGLTGLPLDVDSDGQVGGDHHAVLT